MSARTKTKRYLRRVTAALRACGVYRKSVAKGIRADLEDYLDEHPDATEQALQAHFGHPEEYVKEFLSGMDSEELARDLSAKRLRGKLAVIIAVVLVVLAVALVIWAGMRNNQPSAPTDPPSADATDPTPDNSTAPTVNPYLEHSSPILSDSSQRYLTADDLEQLSAMELALARSEILARQGVIFKDSELDAYFAAQEWYQRAVAEADFDQTTLSDQESANIQLIGLYEKIAGGDFAPAPNNPYIAYYDPDVELLLPKSSNTRLTAEDLAGLNADQLLLLRNQIIALHGYAFDDQELMEYFLQCAWYRPSTPPGRTDLVKGVSALEYDNMRFIFQYEQDPEAFTDAD